MGQILIAGKENKAIERQSEVMEQGNLQESAATFQPLGSQILPPMPCTHGRRYAHARHEDRLSFSMGLQSAFPSIFDRRRMSAIEMGFRARRRAFSSRDKIQHNFLHLGIHTVKQHVKLEVLIHSCILPS